MSAKVDITRCDGCGSCVEVCATEAIDIVDGHAVIDPQECVDCEACVDECANEAISIIDSDQVMRQHV